MARIIERLYPPRSPYRFDVIGVELLGSIYERYLGKTVRVTAKRVFVEDKPEVRKAGGVYYTPKYIVDYIVKNTVGKLVEGKTPRQVEKIRILDLACGSGSFLIGAFQYLIDHHVRYLTAHPDQVGKHPLFPDLIPDGNGGSRLSVPLKARILRNNLHGVDIDPQAVEITMMSLYLKALEGEKSIMPPKQSFLPELKNNIICGNSLIGPDIYEQGMLFADEERDRINAFDWTSESAGFGRITKDGGFDCVIGNPPYGDTLTSKEKDYLVRVGFEAGGGGNNDIFRFMVEKGLCLLQENRPLGMILPNTYLAGSKYQTFRGRLKTLAGFDQIIDFGVQKVFEVDVFSSILILRTLTDEKRRRKTVVRYLSDGLAQSVLLDAGTAISIRQDRIADGDWIPSDPILEQLKSNPVFLRMEQVCEIKDAGINYQRVGVGWQKRARSKLAARILYEGRRQDARDRRYIKGEDVERFQVKPTKQRWLRHNYKHFIGQNEVVAFGKEILEAPQKIVTRQTGDSIIAAIDQKQLYTGRSLHSWVLKHGEPISVALVVGVLNSKLFTHLYQAASRERGRALAQVKLNKLKELPFPNVAKLDSSKRKLCDRIAGAAERIVELNKKKHPEKLAPSELARLEREIDATDEQIDELVYRLYGITEEERKIIEGETAETGTRGA